MKNSKRLVLELSEDDDAGYINEVLHGCVCINCRCQATATIYQRRFDYDPSCQAWCCSDTPQIGAKIAQLCLKPHPVLRGRKMIYQASTRHQLGPLGLSLRSRTRTFDPKYDQIDYSFPQTNFRLQIHTKIDKTCEVTLAHTRLVSERLGHS